VAGDAPCSRSQAREGVMGYRICKVVDAQPMWLKSLPPVIRWGRRVAGQDFRKQGGGTPRLPPSSGQRPAGDDSRGWARAARDWRGFVRRLEDRSTHASISAAASAMSCHASAERTSPVSLASPSSKRRWDTASLPNLPTNSPATEATSSASFSSCMVRNRTDHRLGSIIAENSGRLRPYTGHGG
jgi:hypothetical protein